MTIISTPFLKIKAIITHTHTHTHKHTHMASQLTKCSLKFIIYCPPTFDLRGGYFDHIYRLRTNNSCYNISPQVYTYLRKTKYPADFLNVIWSQLRCQFNMRISPTLIHGGIKTAPSLSQRITNAPHCPQPDRLPLVSSLSETI